MATFEDVEFLADSIGQRLDEISNLGAEIGQRSVELAEARDDFLIEHADHFSSGAIAKRSPNSAAYFRFLALLSRNSITEPYNDRRIVRRTAETIRDLHIAGTVVALYAPPENPSNENFIGSWTVGELSYQSSVVVDTDSEPVRLVLNASVRGIDDDNPGSISIADIAAYHTIRVDGLPPRCDQPIAAIGPDEIVAQTASLAQPMPSGFLMPGAFEAWFFQHRGLLLATATSSVTLADLVYGEEQRTALLAATERQLINGIEMPGTNPFSADVFGLAALIGNPAALGRIEQLMAVESSTPLHTKQMIIDDLEILRDLVEREASSTA